MNLKNFSHIYVEKRVLNYPYVKKILEKFKDGEIIEINHYKDRFNPYYQSFRAQKNSQKLILAKKEPPFLYEASDLIQKQDTNFFYTTPMLNCIYDCHYCFLQGMYPSANVVLFVNFEDFFEEVERTYKKLGNMFLSISYDTDVLAVEKLFGVAKIWADFVKGKNIKLELRTKSVNVNFPYQENLVFAFSLSPDTVIQKYEKFTPSLFARINAVKKIIKKGYKPVIVFDPIIKVPDFKKVYKEFMDKVFSEIDYKNISAVVYGTFRMSSNQFKLIKKEMFSDLYFSPYSVKNGIVEYEDKKEIIEFIESLLPDVKKFKA
ncbi:spore photoproduct lyase [Lebetimonas natsushimae]|uniref:Spore photoproduct lyase n=1 Tax=Lebetimonas natsushimae TaxID=1936991 RepID=A0A292YEB5_9BACT|nr:DNA repair photolyase [Lebetimonas natsushimae]GAX87639.1 spore photoproduct lyase [Lebetimonas natsushimae]